MDPYQANLERVRQAFAQSGLTRHRVATDVERKSSAAGRDVVSRSLVYAYLTPGKEPKKLRWDALEWIAGILGVEMIEQTEAFGMVAESRARSLPKVRPPLSDDERALLDAANNAKATAALSQLTDRLAAMTPAERRGALKLLRLLPE